MKFSIAQALALVGSVTAATYSNTSFVPSGSGFFYEGEIYFDISLPNSGFSSFSIASGAGQGFQFAPDNLSGVYAPSGTPFEVTSDSNAESIDISADIDFGDDDTAALVSLSGPLTADDEEFVGIFVVNLEGLPALIEKRADQEFTITVTATFSIPEDATSTTASDSTTASGSTSVTDTTVTSGTTVPSTLTTDGSTFIENTSVRTHTATSTTLVTITSCEDDKCHETVVPTGVTIITTDETIYTTYCPETSIDAGKGAITITVTKDCTTETVHTDGGKTFTETITTVTTECEYYTPVKPTTGKPTTVAPTTGKPTTVAPTTGKPTTVAPTTKPEHSTSQSPKPSTENPTWDGAANNLSVASGSVFALFTVVLSMLL